MFELDVLATLNNIRAEYIKLTGTELAGVEYLNHLLNVILNTACKYFKITDKYKNNQVWMTNFGVRTFNEFQKLNKNI